MQTTPYLKSAGKSAPKPLLFTLAQPYLKKQSFINLLFMILLLWEMISYRFFNILLYIVNIRKFWLDFRQINLLEYYLYYKKRSS